ncbi:leucine-rich repeat, cysteine-containing subtype protein, partial [Tanacetum coccineum]
VLFDHISIQLLADNMKLKTNGSMETVLECVIPYIHDHDDLNSISLVSRKFYELDSLTRKHLTVHLHYAPNPSRVSHRFPFIESLTLKGFRPDWEYPQISDIDSTRWIELISDVSHEFPFIDSLALKVLPERDFPKISDVDITPWVEEISDKFEGLKALHIRCMVVFDSDLKLLAKTRGKDLQSLKIYKCEGFSENGLLHISEYCNELRTLCLENNVVVGKANGEWLRKLALRNLVIETFHFGYRFDTYDSGHVSILAKKDVTLLAKNCSNSLISLKISPKPLNYIGDAIHHAIKLEHFDGAVFDNDWDYSSFKFPSSIRGLGIKDLPYTSFSFLLPYASQLRELNLTQCCSCFLIERCPNLEVLLTDDECEDMGLLVIGQVCKKLRKLTFGCVTHMGLIALVQGCTNLEYLDVQLLDISNEAIECVGTHLKNLRDFRIDLRMDVCICLPLDNGIQAMLKGCIKLKRLTLSLCDGGLMDVGLGYIGKYGHNLRCLFLGFTGDSDAGLLELSKGCQKLRKLRMKDCPFSPQAVATFVFNIHSLRYIQVKSGRHTVLALTRPKFTVEVLPDLTQYVTLAGKLHKLAVQLVTDGSGLGSVKITYKSSRATHNFITPLVSAMVAQGIYVNEEQINFDGSSDKPLEIIKVQIANVESRLAVALFESGDIKVEGRVKDGVPYLTKVGALDVDVSLEGNIILCTQADQPNIIGRVGSILDEENVNISSMSFGRIAQRKEAVMVIGVDEKPSKKALKKIDEIPDVEFVFLAL